MRSPKKKQIPQGQQCPKSQHCKHDNKNLSAHTLRVQLRGARRKPAAGSAPSSFAHSSLMHSSLVYRSLADSNAVLHRAARENNNENVASEAKINVTKCSPPGRCHAPFGSESFARELVCGKCDREWTCNIACEQRILMAKLRHAMCNNSAAVNQYCAIVEI